MLGDNLLRDGARQPPGAHDEHVLFEMRIARETLECEPPCRDGYEQQTQGSQKNAAANDQDVKILLRQGQNVAIHSKCLKYSM